MRGRKPHGPALALRAAALVNKRNHAARWNIPDPAAFRFWLRESRLACRPAVSQRELGELAGVHPLHIAGIEQGKRDPSLEMACVLWRVLHAAHMGKLWVAIQVRRDGMGDGITAPRNVKLRELNPDLIDGRVVNRSRNRLRPPRPKPDAELVYEPGSTGTDGVDDGSPTGP